MLAGTGKATELEAQLEAMQAFEAATAPNRYIASRPTALAVCRALLLYARGDHAAAAAELAALRPDGLVPEAWRVLGLSNAQRDVLTQFNLAMLSRSHAAGDRSRAWAGLEERAVGGGPDAGWVGRQQVRWVAAAPARL